MLMGVLNAKLGHLVDKGQLQDTFGLRSGVAGAAVCCLDRLEQEEIALSISLPIHGRAVQNDGSLFFAGQL